jgi:hypothetical protein
VFGEQGVRRDVERVLEQNDGGKLGGLHQVGDSRRSGRRRVLPPSSHGFHDAGAAETGALAARSAATCWR